jgi:hypothetical protein
MKRLFLRLAVTLVALGVTLSSPPPSVAVTQVDTSRFVIDPTTLPFGALAGTSTTRYWGIANGAGWRIEARHWNGDLVLYAHGYAAPALARRVNPSAAFRLHCLKRICLGRVELPRQRLRSGTGAEDTKDLIKIFKEEVQVNGKKQFQPRLPARRIHGRPRRRLHDREMAE